MAKVKRVRLDIDPDETKKENNILSWNLETGQISISRWDSGEYPEKQILKKAEPDETNDNIST